MDIRGDLAGHQRQGIPMYIWGQVTIATLHPRLPVTIPPERGLMENINGGWSIGGDYPCIKPPNYKGGMVLDEGLV